MGKESACNVGDGGESGSILGLGRSPGGGNGNPLHYSSLENPMDRGAWQSIVHRVAKNQTQLKQLSVHTPERHAYSLSLVLKEFTVLERADSREAVRGCGYGVVVQVRKV